MVFKTIHKKIQKYLVVERITKYLCAKRYTLGSIAISTLTLKKKNIGHIIGLYPIIQHTIF